MQAITVVSWYDIPITGADIVTNLASMLLKANIIATRSPLKRALVPKKVAAKVLEIENFITKRITAYHRSRGMIGKRYITELNEVSVKLARRVFLTPILTRKVPMTIFAANSARARTNPF